MWSLSWNVHWDRLLYLQVFLVIVEHDGQEDGHEDVGVDEDIHDEEDGEHGAGVVRRHPANEEKRKHAVKLMMCHFLLLFSVTSFYKLRHAWKQSSFI